MKFKCIHTGQVYEFTSDHDIKTMKEHPEYTEVVEAEEQPVKVPKKSSKVIVTEE